MLDITAKPERSPEYYREQWRLYYEARTRRVNRLGRTLAAVGIFALFFALVPDSFQAHHHIVITTVEITGLLLWLTLGVQWFAFNWTMTNWDCPRCGEPFFTSTFIRNPFGIRCRHCGLKRLTKSQAT